ncbi:MAG: cobalt transporter, ATPase subunit [Deltaproteobacteria bacterium]|jgi:cobalt/nickel transport system ATP-binding protein|nr:cobalt transporter, ATPase subunit [Deltaproteobacteria bacterium]
MDDLIRISVKKVSFKYPGGTQSLSNIDLQVRRGEFIGILGANGSGKTTLLKVMDGLLKDCKGSVRLDGREIRELAPKEIYRKVGLIFQNSDEQLFAPTVSEDVAFGPINMGFSGEEVALRVTQALKEVDMEGYGKRSIHHLSFGEKKRICLAGLLAMGQEILLLDEPTDGLDPMGEYRMMNLLMRLNKEKKITIVMATHRVDLVPLFLDRLYILSRGRVVREGSPEDVFTTPDEMEEMRLRLPQIAELIYRLKHDDRLPFDKVPLTIGKAREEISRLVRK